MFELIVPSADLGEEATETRRQAIATVEPLYLAVVDDDRRVLEGLHLALESSGHEVVAGTHKSAVLEALRRGEKAPTVVVSDYRLADGQAGIQVLEAIRHNIPGMKECENG